LTDLCENNLLLYPVSVVITAKIIYFIKNYSHIIYFRLSIIDNLK